MKHTFDVNIAREITGNTRAGRIVTRDGDPVRIICWNAKGEYPIVGLITMGDQERACIYTKEGKADKREKVWTCHDLLTEEPRHWRVSYKKTDEVTITHDLQGYFDLEGVKKFYGLEKPNVLWYTINEIKEGGAQ